MDIQSTVLPHRLLIGVFLLFTVDLLWVASSEVTKYIYKDESFEKPFFCTYVKTSMFTLYLLGFLFYPAWKESCANPASYVSLEEDRLGEEEPYFTDTSPNRLSTPVYVPIRVEQLAGSSNDSGSDDPVSIRSVRFHKMAEVRHMSETDATEALLARLSYTTSVRLRELAHKASMKLPVIRVVKISLVFCLLWFLANWNYQIALAQSEAAMVNVLATCSSLFTLLLAAIFPSSVTDRFSYTKLVAVGLSFVGVFMVCLSKDNSFHLPIGALFSLLSAFFYATYLVFLKRNVNVEEKLDIPLFFGFVGLFNLILLWPLFFFLHIWELEVFEWPNRRQFVLLLLNGLIGTVVSEALWLWACFLTSSLMATLAISLTIPLTMLVDVFVKRISYSLMFYVGMLPMMVAFGLITAVSHYENWDPILDLVCGCWYYFCRRKNPLRFDENYEEQTESLISINADNEHEA